MNQQDSIRARGEVTFQLIDLDGNPIGEVRKANAVTTAGKAAIADQLLASPSLGKPTHMAIGTGTPAGGALGTENNRVALTSKTRSGAIVTMVGTWAPGAVTANITEASLNDAGSSGNTLTTATGFGTLPLGAAVGVVVTWTIEIL